MQDSQSPGGQETAAQESAEPTALGQLAEELTDASAWLPDWLQPVWITLQNYPFLRGLLIAVLGLVLAFLARGLVRGVVGRLTGRTQTNLDDQILKVISRPVFLTVFYASLCLATISLELSATVTGAVVKLLISLTILIWTVAGLKVSTAVLQALGAVKDKVQFIEPRTIPLFDIVSKLLIVLIGSYLILQVWEVDATAWLASAGVVGIAVGFAAKDTLSNLFSGVFIVVDTPYKIGDYVNLDSGERGMVTHVGMRSTRLLTRDDVEITIPNAVIANAKIVNESAGRWTRRRIRIEVGAAYGADLDQVCEVLMSVAEAHPDICPDPPPRVRMRAFGDSAIDFQLMGWIEQPADRGRITHELLMSVYRAFNEAGLEIPFTKQDVYIKEFPGRSASAENDQPDRSGDEPAS